MSLHDLDLLFDEAELDFDGPSSGQLFRIYGIFLADFYKTTLIHRGKNILFNKNKSNHPACKGKYQGFEHLITRKNEYTNRRQYDRDRANRIHWIKPILENWESPQVSYFEEANKDGEVQYFYWVQALSFIVILRELNADLLLVTAYCVDEYNKVQFRKQLANYKNNQAKKNLTS